MLDIVGPGVWFFIFAIGSMVGIFLNVCIYRMPLNSPLCPVSLPVM
jgi:prepilin signal peptidase PulO-like enzyme (type II secretory pathway)